MHLSLQDLAALEGDICPPRPSARKPWTQRPALRPPLCPVAWRSLRPSRGAAWVRSPPLPAYPANTCPPLPAGSQFSAAHWPGPRRPCSRPPGDARPQGQRPTPGPGRARSGAGSGPRAASPAGSAAARPWRAGGCCARAGPAEIRGLCARARLLHRPGRGGRRPTGGSAGPRARPRRARPGARLHLAQSQSPAPPPAPRLPSPASLSRLTTPRWRREPSSGAPARGTDPSASDPTGISPPSPVPRGSWTPPRSSLPHFCPLPATLAPVIP